MMDLAAIKAYLGEDWKRTEEKMGSALASGISLLNSTNDYVRSHSGKQLRPLLCLLIARAIAGRVTEDTVSFAAAVELLHNATLLHDDVADASDERRGQPTVYSTMGPSVSVLVGDYWLVKAMTCVLDSSLASTVMRLFSGALLHLSEGEMLQLEKAESGDTDYEAYREIIFDKTASLFEVVGYSAAISVGADAEVTEAMKTFTTNIGLAFQIRDDIFDYSTGLDVGKPLGVDILEKKITLPLLCAFKNAGPEEEARIRKMVVSINDDLSLRDEIVGFVQKNGGIEGAQKIIEENIEKAIEALTVLGESKEKEMLAALANYIADRRI